MDIYTPQNFIIIGIIQFSILIASAMVPSKLNWKESLASLPKLVQQLFWVYGGYVVLGIASLATICIIASNDLAEDSVLARCFCGYGAAFWGIRLSLQAVLDVKPFLTNWFYKAGYHLLTVAFVILTLFYIGGVMR